MYARGPKQLQNSNKASPNTRCQKCLQLGHHTYQCTNARPYVPRPSRTKQLAMGGPEKDEPSVITPDEFKSSGSSGKGIADKILEAKEKERVRVRAEQAKKESKRQKDNRGDKSKRCIADSSPRSPVESDSDSDSSSVLSSSSDDSRGSGRNLKRPARQARDSDNSDSDASRRSRSPARRRRRYSSGSASSGDGPRRTSPRRDARPRSESPSD